MFDRLTNRLLALVGLDVDFSIDMRGEPFHLIDESVYVGSCPTPERVPQLEAAGITHVVSCRREDERAQVAFLSEHFHVLFLPMHDGMHEDIAAVFPAFFDFASVVESTPGARLLVHCQAGVSRSGTLATALHMRSQRRSFFDAVTHVRTKRPAVLPNIGFASQLQALEHTLRPDARPPGVPSSLARYLREVCCVPAEVDVIQDMLERHHHHAPTAIRAIFGGEIPRVVQGVRD